MTADVGTFLVPASCGRSICVLDARLKAFLSQSATGKPLVRKTEMTQRYARGLTLITDTFKWSGTAHLRVVQTPICFMISSWFTRFWSVEGKWNTSFQIMHIFVRYYGQTADKRNINFKIRDVNEHATVYVLQHLQLPLVSVERSKHEHFTPSRTLWIHHFSIFRLFILSYFSLVALCPGTSLSLGRADELCPHGENVWLRERN